MSPIKSEPIKDYKLKSLRTFSDLFNFYLHSGGFQSVEVGKALGILQHMYNDKDCTKFLSFTANLVATGLRGVIAEMILNGLVDVVITTGGTIDHDLARSLGGIYYHGAFSLDDSKLRESNIHRLGNVLVPLESYGPIVDKFVRDFLSRKQESWIASPSEILNEIGSLINDENSILRACYLKNVPIISPGIVDSAFGTALLYSYQKGKFKLDVMKDEKLMSDKVFEKQRSGAVILGGGISKHHTLWWNQFKDGLDYVVAITTAYEFDGSLSGARISEAISWNKVKPSAEVSNIYGDATVILPLLLAAFYETQNSP